MFIDPKKVAFETKRDVVDYVSRGIIPPSKKNFDQVMRKVISPDEINEENKAKRGKEVIIFDNVITEEERQSVDEVLTRLYGNRVRNRNIRIGIAAVVGIIVAIACIGSKNTKSESEEYRIDDMEEDNGVKVYKF